MTRPGEKGAIRRPRKSSLSIALVYPNVYRVGMGNLGYQFLYQRLNSVSNVAAERFFLPDPSRGKYRSGAALSEESGRPLKNFQLIAFSVPFENDYPNIPGMLLAAGIPPMASDRGPWDPIVIAGGVSVSLNPEPLAPFLDLAFIGEIGDEASPDPTTFLSLLIESMKDFSAHRLDRKLLRSGFDRVPGAYVPSAYSFEYSENGAVAAINVEQGFPHTVRALKRRSEEAPVPVSVLFTPEAEFGASFLVETNRGCGRGCRFCAGGWAHFPVRHAGFKRFRKRINEAIDAGRTIGLIGSDLAGHPELEEMLSHIVKRGGKFSLSSIRPEGLTPKIINLLARTGQKTATLAPETAAPRMKKVIGKEIASDRFYELLEQLVAAGILNLRFYFMIGLPTETEEDAQSIVDFVIESRKIFVEASRPLKKIGKIGVQINPFVPKPWTPFQWAPMLTIHELERRLRAVRKGLSGQSNIFVRAESAKQAIMQGLLSRGDRRIASAILKAAEQTGGWWGVVKKEDIDLDFYVHRERPTDEIFPWESVFHGITKKQLRAIYDRAMSDASMITDIA